VYRAVDQFGQVIDVFLTPRRDAKAARRFFEGAIGTTKIRPIEVVTDQAPTYSVVLDELLAAAWHRTDRYPTTGWRLTMALAGMAATDARPQTGSQCQGDHLRPCVRPEHSTRTLRAGR
jgi:hypothetical protein